MGLTKIAVNIAIPNPKLESFDSYLFIGPHPDDIEIGCGATVAKLVKLKKKITFLICTDGRYGTENLQEPLTEEQLIEVRKTECIKSAKFLGVEDVRFLNLSDGNQYDIQELSQGIAKAIYETKPDVVFAPDPDSDCECHQDHLNVGRLTKELTHFASFKGIFQSYLPKEIQLDEGIPTKAICLYMTGKPNTFVRTNGCFGKQVESILCHSSQYPKDHPATKSVFLYLKLRSFEYGLRKLSPHGDGFRMISRMRMHCLPEASK